jgi:hypothetical protein
LKTLSEHIKGGNDAINRIKRLRTKELIKTQQMSEEDLTLLNIKIKVEFPDSKGNHITTAYMVKKKFSDEDPEWTRNFMKNLLENGYASSNFAEYKLF